MDDIELKLTKIMDSVYVICVALVSITEHECCYYGFEDAVKMAEHYCAQYEADHRGEQE